MRQIFLIDIDEAQITPELISALLIGYFQKTGYHWRPLVCNLTCKATLDLVELMDSSDPKTKALYFTSG